MKSKLKLLALSAAVLAGFAAAPAHAYVYAESRLLLGSLNITVNPSTNFAVRRFDFSATNAAQLNNGAVDAHGGTCTGTFSATGMLTSNSCGTGANPVLDGNASNAAGSTAIRGDQDFSFKGPTGGFQFSNSASVINTSELLGARTTTGSLIAEAQLQGGTSANSNAQIQSITGLSFTFDVGTNGTLSLRFTANPDQLASIFGELGGASAQSSMSTSFTLVQTGSGTQFATWAPSGTAANNCIAVNGVTCVETADGANLNATIGTNLNNDSTGLSDTDSTFANFGIDIGGLVSGTYTLTLQATTSTLLSRTAAVPEPGTLLLLGAGLAGLALRSRRKQK